MTPWIDRCAGVLLHATSLPAGLLDADADRFADFCCRAGFRVWQMLPVGSVDRHGSPYQPDSAFAGNTALFAPGAEPRRAEIASYINDNADWLPDYALFSALEMRYPGMEWHEWPAPLREREPRALEAARRSLSDAIHQVERDQCVFDQAWGVFRRSVNERGLLLFGDVPLFLAHHSADVWVHRHLFELDADGRCQAFTGVPPDAFSADGQWWGYPPFRWDAMAGEAYRWWARRFVVQSRRFDLLRVDHFRGLAAYWRIPQGALSAREGAWTPGPGAAAIEALTPVLHGTRLVAEDLGYITPDVVALRQQLGIPGMRVLQFAFDGDPANPNLPAQHSPDTVCYTGTHDNDTSLGWWRSLDEATRRRAAAHLDPAAMPQALVDLAWSSAAPLSVVPLQDLLGLGSEARMNHPGTVGGNWHWRFAGRDIPAGLAPRLRDRLVEHRRAAPR